MLIRLKNKDTLIVDSFKFKCCIGKNGIKKKKLEGDKSTPRGTFEFGTLYFRKDRVKKPLTDLKVKSIKNYMGWCDDPNNKLYNKEVKINKKIKYEKLFRLDHNYDYFLVIKYNTKKIIKNKGSAIFIHLTNNYKPTAGCIALKKKDFLIFLKLIKINTKIKIN
ncbi:MAG: L,D-peptidoglycan transpeptidase YkuD, ErfK/YbiS/YcfS/YnhG family [Pelagibacterales bacterium]|nr:L,D-peptidoglycan transpeptidase YkuD, ErfK/YbiS/YcfS/YnhG family [Pelagibacterales bacterium]